MKKVLLFVSLLIKCSAYDQFKVDVQAHRGGMALLPENTIPAMLNAVKLGAKTLELDVVISGDGKVVVSHDGYMSAAYMTKPNGTEIRADEEKSLSLFQMPYDSIRRYQSGIKSHPMFPGQQKLKSYKPLLSDLIDSVEAYVSKNKLKPVYYNIETKCSPAGDGKYNPSPNIFVSTLMEVIDSKGIKKRTIIQSFDVRTLQVLHKTEPGLQLALLASDNSEVDKDKLLENDLAVLGFTPTIYSPYYSRVNAEMVKQVHQKKMRIVPWTVDREEDMIALGRIGVDGIITNFPNLLIKMVGSYQL